LHAPKGNLDACRHALPQFGPGGYGLIGAASAWNRRRGDFVNRD
jgi:hypothetical protein